GPVIGEPADQGARGVGADSEARRKLAADGGLHVGGQVGQHRPVELVLGGGARGRAGAVVGQLAQQGASALAGGFLRERDQGGQARGGEDGLRDSQVDVAHGSVGSWLGTTAWARPSTVRCTTGAGGGSARSVEPPMKTDSGRVI